MVIWGIKMKIGQKIAKARSNINLTQDQLAEKLDVSRQAISKWESNLTFPEAAKIAKLAKILNISCDYLLQEEEKEEVQLGVTVTKDKNGYNVDWTKLYPILIEYKNTVDCKYYDEKLAEMIKEMMAKYSYSLDDAILVIKDLLYKSYLNIKNN